MNFKILNIILYPVNKKKNPRLINFAPDKINIITGYSKRGKSSIIEIVDFCLASSECGIPIGNIRNMVDVFALKVSINDKFYFIGRNSPQKAKNSTIMYWQEIDEKGEYSDFNSNKWLIDKEEYTVNIDLVKSRLNSLAGFKNIEESTNSKDDLITVGFRDTNAFQFQSQSIIANGNTIFYNTDDFNHQKRLKKLFPLALGYKSYELLLVEDEIRILESEWSAKNGKVEDLKQRYENWKGDLYEYYTEAISIGLSNADISIEESKVNEIKFELENIIQGIRNNQLFKTGNSIRFSEKLNELQNTRLLFSREIQSFKMEHNKILNFETTQEEYLNSVQKEVEQRLKPIDWFLERKGTDNCPFCDSKSDKAIDQLQKLKEIGENNKKIKFIKGNTDFTFEKEKKELRNKINILEIKIRELDKNIEILLTNKEVEQFQYQKIYEFAGKVENFLKNLVNPNNHLVQELSAIEVRLIAKRTQLKKIKEKFNKELVLDKVTKTIKKYVNQLPIENKQNCNVILEPDSFLGIKIQDKINETTTFLNKIGSGSNYMCYHIATLLGLHDFFNNLPSQSKTNYIPSFLILDQPSQVYFPDNFPESIKEENKAKSEDFNNTREIFEVCSSFMNETNNDVQIIILEHAPAKTWENIENINLVEAWRGSNDEDFSEDFNALIQADWFTEN